MNKVINWGKLGMLAAALSLALTVSVARASNTPAGAYSPANQTGANPTNSITVVGFGEASAKPDVALVQLGVEVTDPDAGKALAGANENIANVTKAIVALGIAEADVQTTGINIFSRDMGPQPTEPGATIPRTYQAQIMLSVRVRDVTKAGPVIDAAVKAGANNVYGLSFNISDPA